MPAMRMPPKKPNTAEVPYTAKTRFFRGPGRHKEPISMTPAGKKAAAPSPCKARHKSSTRGLMLNPAITLQIRSQARPHMKTAYPPQHVTQTVKDEQGAGYDKGESTLQGSSKCHPEIIAIPDAQETSDDPCDVGTDPSVLCKVVTEQNWPVDLSLVKNGWNVKDVGTRYSPESTAIATHAQDARIFIRQRKRQLIEQGDTDPQVALVTHGGFLHYFTDDWEDSWLNRGTGWKSCETRSYVFERDVMNDTDVEARLTETMESRLKRGKGNPMPVNEDQAMLFEQAMESWEKQGLQRPDRMGINIETNVIA
ncbi:phosphoglycerate mutase family [Fusarium mundagurra]|uniref:Phosphoglycerate mutase family n=1 Tax=Fusarium mundagurra TaxID=1567541 RepID=A0A8H5Z7Q5_9HYPO|nr:phosphoglycerate mutase family [Fusarium mundagurra]